MMEGNPNLKLIWESSMETPREDDPEFPFILEVVFGPSEYMPITFIGLYGPTVTVVIGGKSQAALEGEITERGLRTHPQTISLTIKGPKGDILEHFIPPIH